eukprot:m.168510 g.168510  ORF g.168510 m.168510 type:complete len:329 (+) comp18211_c0_seq1:20-1006(+)
MLGTLVRATGIGRRLTMESFVARADQAEQLVATLRNRLGTLRGLVEQEEIQRLTAENEALVKEIEAAKQRLRDAETKAGKKQVPLPGEAGYVAPPPPAALTTAEISAATKGSAVAQGQANIKSKSTESDKTKKQEEPSTPKPKSKPEKAKSGGGGAKKGTETSAEDDVTVFDLRVGLVVTAKPHPESDKLYIEDVDVGEPERRTILSGLNGRVPLDSMQNRPVVIMCNLKPQKMAGIESCGMVMCADNGTACEPLDPPPGTSPGDVISFPGISGIWCPWFCANETSLSNDVRVDQPVVIKYAKMSQTVEILPFDVIGTMLQIPSSYVV